MTSENHPRPLNNMKNKAKVQGELLIVDDEAFIQNAFKLYFETLGYKVWTAEGKESALERFQSEDTDIDLILLDLVMPKCNGIDLLKRFKQEDPNIEVIIATGCGSISSAIEAMRYGAFDYVTKPIVDFEKDLLKIVEDALLRRRHRSLGSIPSSFSPSPEDDGATHQALNLFQNLTAWSQLVTQPDILPDFNALTSVLSETLYVKTGLFYRYSDEELTPVSAWGGAQLVEIEPRLFANSEIYNAVIQNKFHTFSCEEINLDAFNIKQRQDELHPLICHAPMIGEKGTRGSIILFFDAKIPAFNFEGILHNGAPFQLAAALLSPFLFSLPVPVKIADSTPA